ncbi:MAG: hypothetical protein EU532_10600, partial [Promethearchaeota archaeon]
DHWRKQLAQHHTATHIVNAAAREVLGSHINQAGAKKTIKKSHLDVTHYEQISKENLMEIEQKANEIVKKALDLHLDFIPRSEAEKQYGVTIYQGGAVPGKNIRIVEIPGIEVEACGGTHLNNTSEAGEIKITKSQKIQDGIVRLSFTAGEATQKLKEKNQKIINQLKSILGVESDKIVGRVEELVEKWKSVNKALKTGKTNEKDLKLVSKKTFKGDIITELSSTLNIKKDQLISKVQKIYSEWNEGKEKLDEMQNLLSDQSIEKLINEAQKLNNYNLIIRAFENLNQDDLKNLSIKVLKQDSNAITIFLNKNDKGVMMLGMLGENPSKSSELNMGEIIQDCVVNFGGKGGGRLDYGQGFIPKNDLNIDIVLDYIQTQISKT